MIHAKIPATLNGDQSCVKSKNFYSRQSMVYSLQIAIVRKVRVAKTGKNQPSYKETCFIAFTQFPKTSPYSFLKFQRLTLYKGKTDKAFFSTPFLNINELESWRPDSLNLVQRIMRIRILPVFNLVQSHLSHPEWLKRFLQLFYPLSGDLYSVRGDIFCVFISTIAIL